MAVRLVAHIDAVMIVMTRHSDVAKVVEEGLGFLHSISRFPVAARKYRRSFFELLFGSEHPESDGKGPLFTSELMAHVGAVISAMTRHAEAESICRHGVCFLRNLSKLDGNISALKASGVAAAVRLILSRNGHLNARFLRFCNQLLSRLA